jgi:hypothetical protein
MPSEYGTEAARAPGVRFPALEMAEERPTYGWLVRRDDATAREARRGSEGAHHGAPPRQAADRSFSPTRKNDSLAQIAPLSTSG